MEETDTGVWASPGEGAETCGEGEEDTAKRSFGNVHRQALGSLTEHQFAPVHDQTPKGLGENNTQRAEPLAKPPEIRRCSETLYLQPTPVKRSHETQGIWLRHQKGRALGIRIGSWGEGHAGATNKTQNQVSPGSRYQLETAR